MIKNIFLPDRIGNYYLFSQKIVGIDIQPTLIVATQIVAHGSKITVEKVIVEQLDMTIKNINDRIIAALILIKEKIPARCIIHTALDSSLVVFKELTLPFLSREKITQVIGYEVEPLLPFARDESIIDFIITKQDKEQQSSQIIAMAIQKAHLAQLLSRFEQAELTVHRITVDICALYDLYKIIPSYAQITDTTILWDLTQSETTLALLQNGQLRIIRNLPNGTATIAKQMSESCDSTPQQAIDYIMRLGLSNTSDNKNYQALSNAITGYFSKIQFALSTILRQTHATQSPVTILLIDHAKQIQGFGQALTTSFSTPTQDFDILKLKENPRYHIADGIETLYPTSLAIALPIGESNFRKGIFELPTSAILFKQIIMGAFLTFILFSMLITQTIIQTTRLRNEKYASEQEAIEMLRERFPEIEDSENLDDVYEEAQTLLKKEQDLWGSFSNQSRTQFLEYLLEITHRINKSKLGFIPKQISMTDKEITLTAQVNDYEALAQLQDSLNQSKLFTYEKPQTPDFTIKLFIKRTGGSL